MSFCELMGGDKYFDGTSLVVSGFSELALSDNNGAKLIDLLRGDLSVDAKPQPEGKPMKVISPVHVPKS